MYFPKAGGSVGQAMPVCMPPPVLTTTQQSYPLQSQIPVLQSGFSIPRPISVPGPNGFYGAKFSWNFHSDFCYSIPLSE